LTISLTATNDALRCKVGMLKAKRKRIHRAFHSVSKPSTATHLSETNAMDHPSFGEAFRFWLKLGFISFGGPTGQIAIMQTELVEKKKWISQSRFLHALNFCMLLPDRRRSS
jgi:hypothetical protein